MKVLQVFLAIMFLTSFAKAQACGYTFLTIYLTDSKGYLIKNAKLETFDKNFKKEFFLYPKNKTSYDRLERSISWSEEKQAYYGSEGMCGGHRDIGFRISAEGFETFDKVIDLPLGWTSYSVKLKQKRTGEIAGAIKLSHFLGKVIDETAAAIPLAELEIADKEGRKYVVGSNENGMFGIGLPNGNYTVRVSKNGFRILKVINFQIEDTETIRLDLTLKVRGCDDCNGDILGENNEEERKEVILDYQIIKRKIINNE